MKGGTRRFQTLFVVKYPTSLNVPEHHVSPRKLRAVHNSRYVWGKGWLCFFKKRNGTVTGGGCRIKSKNLP